jgi:hypothetical protein
LWADQAGKRGEDGDRLLRVGVAAGSALGFDERWQAVVDLSDLEIRASAFVAWANWLMLTLGEAARSGRCAGIVERVSRPSGHQRRRAVIFDLVDPVSHE